MANSESQNTEAEQYLEVFKYVLKGMDIEYAKYIQELNDLQDVELAHILADSYLIQILQRLEFDKTVEAFSSLKKWYS